MATDLLGGILGAEKRPRPPVPRKGNLSRAILMQPENLRSLNLSMTGPREGAQLHLVNRAATTFLTFRQLLPVPPACAPTNPNWRMSHLRRGMPERSFANLEQLDLTGLPEQTVSQILGFLSPYCSRRMTSCSLSRCHLSRLPDNSMRSLSLLTHLDLSQNDFTKLPLVLCELVKLESLDLSCNQLQQLPSDIQAWKKLRVLHLSNNPLGHFPTALGTLPLLEELYCWQIGVTELPRDYFQTRLLDGTVPLQSLHTLDLHGNRMDKFPSSWCEPLKGLRSLNLSSNRLLFLPSQIEQMNDLEELNVRSNQLLLLPPALARLRRQLKSLYICYNSFCTPPTSYRGAALAYYGGLLPGEYYDIWILRCLNQCLMLNHWDTVEMKVIGQSIHCDLLRRHILKAIQDAEGGPLKPGQGNLEVKLLMLHTNEPKVILSSLKELGTSYLGRLHEISAVDVIGMLLSSDNEEVVFAATKVLANLCLHDESESALITQKSLFSESFMARVKELIRRQNCEYLETFVRLSANGTASFHRVIDPSEIEMGKRVGRGVAGEVFEAMWNGKKVAVKSFNPEIIDLKEFRMEIAVMSLLDHPSIISCYGGYSRKRQYLIVMPLFPGGTLHDALHPELSISMEELTGMSLSDSGSEVNTQKPTSKCSLSFEKRVEIALQIAEALLYMHEMNFIHRDMKAENLLLDSEMNVCLADLGISCLRAQRTSKAMGTPQYMAPELLEGIPYNETVDVYSFAVLFWEILSGEMPYAKEGWSTWELIEKVVEGYRPTIPAEWPKTLTAIIQSSWSANPAGRPSMSLICEALRPFKGMSEEAVKGFGVKRQSTMRSSPSWSRHQSSSNYQPADIFKEAAERAKQMQTRRGSPMVDSPPPSEAIPIEASTSPPDEAASWTSTTSPKDQPTKRLRRGVSLLGTPRRLVKNRLGQSQEKTVV